MKSYFAPKQMSLVGKAWEIRAYLRKMVRSNPAHTSFSHVLMSRNIQREKK